MAKKKTVPETRPVSVRYSFFQAVAATAAIIALFSLLNFFSVVVEPSIIPSAVFFIGLVVVVVLFLALRRPDWAFELKNHPRLAAFVLVQMLLVIFFAVEFFQAIQIDFDNRTFGFSSEPLPYVFMGLIVLALVLLNFALKKKNTLTYELQSDAKFIVRETARIKLKRSRENPYSIALFAYEIAYVVIIAYAISYYFNPSEELIPWNELEASVGIEVSPPLTTLFHILGFIVLTAILFLFHSYAAQFDSIKFQGRKGIKKIREKKKKK